MFMVFTQNVLSPGRLQNDKVFTYGLIQMTHGHHMYGQ